MSNHTFRNIVSNFPVMKTVLGINNTNANLHDFLNQMKETPQYMMRFNHETGEIEIWLMMSDGQECKVSMYNTTNACTIYIERILSGKILSSESHKFNPFGFSLSVNSLLTPEDLEKQIAFRDQEKLREDVLERAHNSEKCVVDCKYCKYDKRLAEISTPARLGGYT